MGSGRGVVEVVVAEGDTGVGSGKIKVAVAEILGCRPAADRTEHFPERSDADSAHPGGGCWAVALDTAPVADYCEAEGVGGSGTRNC